MVKLIELPEDESTRAGASLAVRKILRSLKKDHPAFTVRQVMTQLDGEFTYEQTRQALFYLERMDEVEKAGYMRGRTLWKRVME